MYALKRILAFIIDMVLIAVPVSFIMPIIYGFLSTSLHIDSTAVFLGYLLWPISMGLPVIIFGILIGLFGRTPGKLLMFLKVKGYRTGDPIGIPHGILREIIKLVCFTFFFGIIWALYGIATSEKTFYDDWLAVEVEDLRPFGLTETQKNWRKYMKSK